MNFDSSVLVSQFNSFQGTFSMPPFIYQNIELPKLESRMEQKYETLLPSLISSSQIEENDMKTKLNLSALRFLSAPDNTQLYATITFTNSCDNGSVSSYSTSTYNSRSSSNNEYTLPKRVSVASDSSCTSDETSSTDPVKTSLLKITTSLNDLAANKNTKLDPYKIRRTRKAREIVKKPLRSKDKHSTTGSDISKKDMLVKSLEERRKYICKVCTKGFTTSGHLARHNRIHTGEKNHSCPFESCEQKFSRQDNCLQHYRTHFKNKFSL